MAGAALGLSMLTGFGSGFAFGTGYGAGVRFGYEDVYPYLKGNMSKIADMLQIPYASSGFKLASGVTEHQGLGLSDAEGSTGGMGLQNPEQLNTEITPSGKQVIPVMANLPYKSWNGLRGSPPVGAMVDIPVLSSGSRQGYHHVGNRYRFDGRKWVIVGSLSGYKPLITTA